MIPIHVFRPELDSAKQPAGRSSPLPSIVGVHWTAVTTFLVFAYLVADKLFCMAVNFAGIVFGQQRRYATAITGERPESALAETGFAKK